MPLVIVTLLLFTCSRASFIWIDNTWDLERASYMDFSLPRTRCHLLFPILFLVQGMVERIYWKHASWCGGSNNFVLAMLVAHPKRIWHVYQFQSYVYILLR